MTYISMEIKCDNCDIRYEIGGTCAGCNWRDAGKQIRALQRQIDQIIDKTIRLDNEK